MPKKPNNGGDLQTYSADNGEYGQGSTKFSKASKEDAEKYRGRVKEIYEKRKKEFIEPTFEQEKPKQTGDINGEIVTRNTKVQFIAKYIMDKESQNSQYAIREAIDNGTYRVLSETEKALKYEFHTQYGNVYLWVPKSAVNKESEYQIQKEQMAYNRQLSAFDRHAKLIAWAKENGVKGLREFTKGTTLRDKIAKAGLKIPEELRSRDD